MAWFHKDIRNGLVAIAGGRYNIDDSGQLSPDPSDNENALSLVKQIPEYFEVVEKKAPAKKAPAKKAAAKKATPKKPAGKKAPAKKEE